jgi:PKD repeat protein
MGVLFVFGCADQATQPTSPDGDLSAAYGETGPPQELGPALAAQRAHSDRLMGLRDVVGTAVGIDDDGEASVVVYLTRPGAAGVPERLDDVPVERVVTGLITAGADPTTRSRPAPTGFSVGHPDITAGTYGARVVNGSGNTFMLSNNHVLANSNDASIGDATLQPGPSDGGTDPGDRIGTLADFEPIDFENDNVMDAAIAAPEHADSISASTPTDDAYGAPGTTVTEASVGMNVQKYGRTTGLTQGTVEEVNVRIAVCYEPAGPFMCKQAATFVDQIGIGPGTFSDGGDSGSLIVTDDSNADPVGLLFAGGSDRTFANPIGPVLNRFSVSVDDGSGEGGGTTNDPPSASFDATCADLTCDFDASGSSDPDGSIASYDWDFGDGNTATGATTSHTYDAGGTYAVTLTVTDDDGATDSSSQDVTVSSSDDGGEAGGIHVGDLDGSQDNNGSTWTAHVTVLVHDADHTAEDGSTVDFDYTGRDVSGSATCTTDTNGVCTLSVSNIAKRTGSVDFTVTGVSDSDGSYDESSNHDPDGDSDGTTITVNKP